MPTPPQDKDRPEAGADTETGRRGEGTTQRDAESGGTRTPAGGTYGDFVPDKPRGGDDRERQDSNSDAEQDEAEKVAEDNRNKPFDTTHTHSSTTSRKV